jgi:hypothetical protein
MNWVIFSIFAVVLGFNLYCSIKFLSLYRRGVVPDGERISLAKLQRSLNSATTGADRRKIISQWLLPIGDLIHDQPFAVQLYQVKSINEPEVSKSQLHVG